MRARVSRWGNSLAIRLPREVASRAEVAEGTEIEITLEDRRIVVRPMPTAPTLEELVDAITDEHRHEETDWGGPVGREAW